MDYKALILKYGIELGLDLVKKAKAYFDDKKESKDKLESYEESLKQEKTESEQREDHKSFIK